MSTPTPKAPTQSVNHALYYMMIGFTGFALLFLFLTITNGSATFFMVFIVEAVAALSLYLALSFRLSGHFKGVVIDRGAITREWEARNINTTAKPE